MSNLVTMKISSKLLFLVLLSIFASISGWVTSLLSSCSPSSCFPSSIRRFAKTVPRSSTSSSTTCRKSSPFEADFYDNPYEDDVTSSTEVPADTKLVIGLNKYSHDTAICAADATTGKVLFALSKERLTRSKHDSGNVALLVESCLDTLNLQLDNICTVIMNNHHHRIIPVEQNIQHLEWECGLNINGGREDGYDEPENLLPDVSIRHELSHHLAHAYSTATQAPFNNGLCIVMDGMGESFRSMQEAIDTGETTYTSDLSFGLNTFRCIPSNIHELASKSRFDYREAESVYVFKKTKDTIDIKPVFKRFTPENTPPTLYNHGFENMDSVGALYSRASSHIFGDWNACGKVMGLAPWAGHTWALENKRNEIIKPSLHQDTKIMWGKLQSEKDKESFKFDRSLMEGMPYISRNDPDLYDSEGKQKKRYDFDDNDGESTKLIPVKVALEAVALAHRIQIDLEDVVLDFVKHYKEETGASNLCLAGGVALNSVLNGRIARELGFERTFISPYPGDDGIAVGCCAFGLFGNPYLKETTKLIRSESQARLWNSPIPPYLGPDPSEAEIKAAIEAAEPWLEVEAVRNVDQRIQMMVQEVNQGAVIAWYRSRSELGPRALGHRSILADPRKKGLVGFINRFVKSRESFRPFAPSVLAEEATKWFDLGGKIPTDGNVSPYMSMTAIVHQDKRALIPAVTHVDGSSRMQTVTKLDEPLYHKFISKFFELTGVPMVLNTSFNTLPSEPIVESPKDAIRSFLFSMGSIEMLVMGDYVIRRKKPDVQKLLGEASRDGFIKSQPLCPKRAGPVKFQTTFELDEDNPTSDDVQAVTKVSMPDRPMHGKKNEWVELLDDLEGEILAVCDGTVTLNEILAEYSPSASEGESLREKDVEATQNILQNVVHRMVRLYEETLIGW